MDIDLEIFDKAKLLMKENLDARAEKLLKEMCVMARFELEKRLKSEISLVEIRDQFVRAAGALAVSLFIGLETSEVESFSAGSVSVKKRGVVSAKASAESLRWQAELMLCGYLEDRSFDFRTVKY
ncbi:MAG: hypothetical protein RRY04_01180 [Oscillospiraceae bacterium]